MAASVLRGHRLGHPGVVGWPSRWIGLALPASIAYTALGGIRLIDPAGVWIGPPSLVTGGPPAPGVWWWMILAPIFLGVLLFDPGFSPRSGWRHGPGGLTSVWRRSCRPSCLCALSVACVAAPLSFERIGWSTYLATVKMANQR